MAYNLPRYINLQLSLDHPNRLYAPGDTITGTVSGWDPNSDRCPVHIILEGCSTSCMRIVRQAPMYYVDRSPLQYQMITLNPANYNKATQETYFALVVPVRATPGYSGGLNTSHWTHSWSPHPEFEQAGGHPLPPSMIMPTRSLGWMAANVQGWAYIRYTLAAIPDQVHLGQDLTIPESSRKHVWITTSRLPVDEVERLKAKDPTTFVNTLSLASQRLNPGIGDRKLTFRESLRGKFKETPFLRFSSRITLPKIAVVGARIQLSVRLEALPPNNAQPEYDFPLPPITLERISLSLRNRVALRCKGHSVTETHDYEFRDEKPRNRSCSPGHIFYPTSDGRRYRDVGCEVTFDMPDSCVPTHRTCNIRKTWYVKGEAVFACVGKEKRVRFESQVVLIPKPRRKGVGASGHGQGGGDPEDLTIEAEHREEEREDEDDVEEIAEDLLDALNNAMDLLDNGMDLSDSTGDLVDL